MIFRLLGQVVRRAWPVLLLGWAVLFIASWSAAPPFDEVAQDKEFAFLPAVAPSRQAEAVYAAAFPDDQTASNIVLVLHRAGNAPGHLARDLKFISDVLEPGLRKIADDEGGLAGEAAPSDDPLFGDDASAEAAPTAPKERSIIARIHTPNALGAGGLLVSPDGQALLVVLDLTTDMLVHRNWPTITRVENFVAALAHDGKIPDGAALAVTGSAVIGRDHARAQVRSVRSTEILTVVLVIGLLVLIYRAPLLALIPLATVVLSVQLSLYLLAILARAGYVNLFDGIQIYITILAYGAGVDYCLFLTARYKEELDRGTGPAEAVAAAVGGVGAALVASAATVICGIAMMWFAEFGKFHEAGFAVPFSLVIVLAATLTFSAPLLRLAGRWAFWPQKIGAGPGAPATPPNAQGITGRLARMWDDVGRLLLRRPGTVWLVTVAAMAPLAIAGGLLYNHLSYDLIGDLPADVPSVAGTRALKEHFPAGILGPVTIVLVQPNVDFSSPSGQQVVAQMTGRLRADKDALGLADIRTLSAPLGITAAAEHPFAGSGLPADVQREAARKGALARYVTTLGGEGRKSIGTRIDLVLSRGPFTQRSITGLDAIESAIRAALPADLRADARVSIVGTTASVRDLAAVMRGDRTRIELLVLASVFVILVLLLRSIIVPIYLLASVLFSYYATLGVAFLVFWALDPAGFTGIDWKVAIFLFTILIAVGEDYNIFLMTRVREEARQYGPLGGITAALTRTGPIISSCGIIMAGTFASLLGGSLTEMKQLGFALTFGVLLDTFVVRPILVPAFLILLERRRLRRT